MRFVFRVDASTEIGSGHVIRCLTLATELRRQGHECIFICREHFGHLGELIGARRFTVHLLPNPRESTYRDDVLNWNRHADWLQVHWEEDAVQSLSVLTVYKNIDWLVVDNYALDIHWEQRVRAQTRRILVIDDLADRLHECDILLDQNVIGDDAVDTYKALVNASCSLLLGPCYALLAPEYKMLAQALPERDGVIARVLVFVGGSDPNHLTERYLQALTSDKFAHLFVDVVVGKNHPNPEAVRKLVTARLRTRLYCGLPSLAVLMVRADIMLGAGGTTNWERLCLGLNSVVVSVAHNQHAINKTLADKHLIEFLGDIEQVSVEKISSKIESLLSNSDVVQKRSNAMRKVVDGLGVTKVVEKMLGNYYGA